MGENKQKVGVFVTDKDLNSDVVMQTLKKVGLIPEKSKDYSDWGEELLVKVLREVFGFKDGYYEKVYFDRHKTLFGEEWVKGYRFIGVERLDKEWALSDSASREAKEIYKFGTIIEMGDDN